MKMYRYLLIFMIYVHKHNCFAEGPLGQCYITDNIRSEIASYLPVVMEIIQATTEGSYKGYTYDELATFVDTFGNRIAGSENLEDAIDYMLSRLKEANLDNVHGEDVTVPYWIRGNESAEMLQPRYQKLQILGLGSSIATPPEGIEAEAIVVNSFRELEENADEVAHKIVIFNEEFETYEKTAKYRFDGASIAADFGALATLIRSVTPFSINSPHTGWQDYAKGVRKIPTACITVEDARMFARMQSRGDKIIIRLKMGARMSEGVSRNTVSEIEGRVEKNKVVLVSGHLDSWDVGQGAMDDGGGAFISWAALAVLRGLGLRPRRTLRAVLWTGEEQGLIGAHEYARRHQNETHDWVFIMESDEGTFTPLGLQFSGSFYGACVLREILKLMKPINATQLKVLPDGDIGSDIQVWTKQGATGAALLNAGEKYFWFHHTNGDNMDMEDSPTLDKVTALWASVAYVIADMSFDFPGYYYNEN